MGFLAFQRDSTIVVLIGDNGAVVVNIVDGVIQNKYFVDSVQSREWSEVKKCICSSRKSDVYMVLDHSSQVYSRHVPPASAKLGSGSVAKCVRAGMADEGGFSTSFLVSSNGDTKSKLQCMLVESRINDELYREFLGLLSGNTSNKFNGVLLLSTELACIAADIAGGGGKAKEWVVFVAYTKAGDFRQVVLHNGELFSSTTIKVLSSEKEQPSLIAGKVYQSVQDAVRDVTACHDAGEDMLLCMVVPGSVKSSLLSFDLKREDINVLTPYELGKVLKAQDCVSVGGVYCDAVIMYAISRRREFRHVMHTRESLIASRSQKLKIFAIFPTFMSIVLVGALYMLNTVEVINIKDMTSRLDAEFAKLTEELRIIRDDQEFARINEMYDVVDLYKSLSSVSRDPIDILAPLSRVKRDGFKFTSFSWTATEDFGVSVVLRVLMQADETINWNEMFTRTLGGRKVVDVATVKDIRDELVIHIEGE